MDSKEVSDNTQVDRDFNVPDNSWVVHQAPERPRRQLVFVVGALAVICLGAWILQNLWDSPSVVIPPPVTTQSTVSEPISEAPVLDESVSDESVSDETVSDESVSDETVSDETLPEEPPIVAGQALVALLDLDEWPGIAGAMILRGGAGLEDAVDVTIIGDQVSVLSPAPVTTSRLLWLSTDGKIVAYSVGIGRSDDGDWSWIAKADTIVDPNEGALWSVDHKRREIAFVYKDPTTRSEAYELDPEVEQVLGRLENGFLVVRGLDSGGTEYANWTDDGPMVSIDGLAGRQILDIGSSVVLLRAAQDQIVAMDVSEPGTVTAVASMSVDFQFHRVCLSPNETLIAVLGRADLSVIDMDSGTELIHEQLVDDFTWTADRQLMFTRRNSLLASDLNTAPVRVAELAPDYWWQVASSTSPC